MRTVIIFTTNYRPFIGGAEVAIEEITKRLKDNFRFIVVTSRMNRKLLKKEERPEGMIFRVGMGSRFDTWLLLLFGGFIITYKLKFGEWREQALAGEILLWGVDISQGSMAAACVSFFSPTIPFVINLQYGYGDERLSRGRLGAIRVAFRRMLGRATYMTTISAYLADIACQYGWKGQKRIIPNGVDILRFKQLNMGLKKGNTIITTSRLVPKNGVDILIAAIAEIKKKIPDIRCIIAGDGPERKKLELLATELGVEKNIRFLGVVPNIEIPKYLDESDCFVRPSRSEGMGNVFLEALAAGIPIIGTPVGGIPDIIKDGETGLFALPENPMNVAEKIIQLLGDRDLSGRIVENGRKMIQNSFGWDKIAQEYKAVFESELSMRDRIVIATPLYPPDIGGPATYSKILLENLPSGGVGVSLAYFGDIKHFPKIISHVAYFFNVLMKARGKDLVFAQDPVSTGFPALIAAKLLGKKFCVKIVGDYAWEQWQQKKKQRGRFIDPEGFQNKRFDVATEIRRYTERFVAKSADVVIVPSTYLKKIITLWCVPLEKVEVIPNAFEIPETFVSRKQAREDLALSGTALVSAGRLVPWKGFEMLIRLMPQVLKKIPDAMLYIVGEGPERERIISLIRALGLERSVKMPGALSHQEFLTYLRGGDIFLLNTGYEGLSHVLLEAMAMEIPVVTTNVCGNPELIENGVEGILVDYNNEHDFLAAIHTMLSSKDLREKIVECAKKKLEKFSKLQMIKSTKEILFQ